MLRLTNMFLTPKMISGKSLATTIQAEVLTYLIIWVHNHRQQMYDQYCENSKLANLLSGFDYPEFPVPMRILRLVEHVPYEDKIEQQIKT